MGQPANTLKYRLPAKVVKISNKSLNNITGIPECCSEVELLAAVVHLVNSPQEPHFMTGTVEAIVSEV